MTTKYTPGPYIRDGRTVYALEFRGYRKGVEQYRNRFTAGVTAGPDTPEDEALAVAALFEAAPDLLHELKRALFDAEGGDAIDGHAIRAVIAKAEGET